MEIQKTDLEEAVASGLITKDQAEKLFAFIASRNSRRSTFNLGYIIYYLGGALILSAVIWFIVVRWGLLQGLEITLSGLVGLLGFGVFGSWLSRKRHQDFPATFLLMASALMASMIFYGVQKHFGWVYGLPADPEFLVWLKNSYFVSATVVFITSVFFFYFFEFALLGLPMSLAFGVISLELARFRLTDVYGSLDLHDLSQLITGLVILFCSYLIDIRVRHFNVFWGYLIGASWTGYHLTHLLTPHIGEGYAFLYLVINLLFIFLGLFLRRIIFGFLGSIGVLVYTHHFVFETFYETLSSLIMLVSAGIAFLLVGLWFQKKQSQFYNWIDRKIPSRFKSYRPEFKEFRVKNLVV